MVLSALHLKILFGIYIYIYIYIYIVILLLFVFVFVFYLGHVFFFSIDINFTQTKRTKNNKRAGKHSLANKLTLSVIFFE